MVHYDKEREKVMKVFAKLDNMYFETIQMEKRVCCLLSAR